MTPSGWSPAPALSTRPPWSAPDSARSAPARARPPPRALPRPAESRPPAVLEPAVLERPAVRARARRAHAPAFAARPAREVARRPPVGQAEPAAERPRA